MSANGGSGYLLDNRTAQAGTRFDALATLFDPWSMSHIDHLGIREGWRCWEVGAGGTSLVRLLAQRVGPRGRVLATDIDLSWARDAQTENVEVRKHAVGRDEPPQERFDLVHARIVLVHVEKRALALESMVRTLRPGGWLLVEDADPALQPLACPDERGPAEALANRVRAGFRQLLARRGVDLAYGRKLPHLLRDAGLKDVCAEAYFPLARPACAPLEAATVEMLHGDLIALGSVSEAEIDSHLENVASGALDLTTAPLVSAWGHT